MRLLASLAALAPALGRAGLSVRGPDLFDGEVRVKLKGIGLTCTEYMTKPGMDDAGKGEHVGQWAYTSCFGGPPSNASSAGVQLNQEPGNVLKYLRPDTLGGAFRTKTATEKVSFAPPYDRAVRKDAPEARPVTRIPLTGSMYLYDDGAPHQLYQGIVDELVSAFTGQGVAVILDLHWNCPDSSAIPSCTGAQAAPMALRSYGEHNGTLAFWDAVSRRYAGNGLVLYELFNEPWIQQFGTWYRGDETYVGMKEMYQAVRRNDPEGLVVIGGKDQYALDAQSGLAFYLQYKKDTGAFPTNVLWNVHPYVGGAQGLEHSLRSALRLALALQTVGPVIFTEFGQYCCGGGSPCGSSGGCNDAAHGANFVHNVVNMAEQFDISWVGWAWRGANVNNAHRPCADGMAECSQPDVRDVDEQTGLAVLTDGKRGGADWRSAWARFAAPPRGRIAVEDVAVPNVSKATPEVRGFLPRPCIEGEFNLGNICGWDGSTDVTTLEPADFTGQSLYTSILPGLPGACEAQGCAGHPCGTYTGPCHHEELQVVV